MLNLNEKMLAEYTSALERCGVATVPDCLEIEARTALLCELERYHMQPQPSEYGKYNVKQAFSSVSDFRNGSPFFDVRDELEQWLERERHSMTNCPLLGPVGFTELVVQTYMPCPVGISAHRDGKSFINLIAVFVLEGKGRFCVCSNRKGMNAHEVRNEPGDLLLMRGPGFGGSDYQPFHFVDNITEKRTTFALRQKLVW